MIRLADKLTSRDTRLPPTRIVDVHTSTARAHLDLGDQDSAQTSLFKAWNVAPQKAKVHPMNRVKITVQPGASAMAQCPSHDSPAPNDDQRDHEIPAVPSFPALRFSPLYPGFTHTPVPQALAA